MKGVAVVWLTLILALVLAEAVPEYWAGPAKVPKPKPKKVKCKDKYSPCYHKQLLCPNACPRNCSVDCTSCQAVCTPIPPPPPKVQKPKQVKCKDKKFPSCYNKKLLCPASCPKTCSVDCTTCQPVCGALYPPPPTSTTPLPPPPPPPPSSASKQVRCKNRNYPGCYYREFTCPAACPQTCEVDCVTCSPVCSKFIKSYLILDTILTRNACVQCSIKLN